MIDLQPFRGLRYDPVVVGDIGRVLAPPYDVIAEDERERLHQSHPHNIIRLILGKPQPGDGSADNVYTRAAATFADWRARGVLRRDDQPGFYLYEQTFALHRQPIRRLGFIGLLRLDASAESGVFRHEQTFAGPKTDREQLLQAVRANLSPIFCLYSDSTTGIYQQLVQWTRRQPPVIDAQTDQERQRVWQVSDPGAIEALRQAMHAKQIVIADGHHRYEVALANRHLFPAVMAYFGWLEDPAMVVLPIHRLVQLGRAMPLEEIERRLTRCVEVAAVSDPGTLFRMLESGKNGAGLFGLYAQGRYRLLRLRCEGVETSLARHGAPAAWAALDVALVHYILLPELTDGQPPVIGYTKDAAEAAAWADGAGDRVAFLLNPVPVRRIQEIALQGHRLPQKSTYFHPKLLSGVVINPFD